MGQEDDSLIIKIVHYLRLRRVTRENYIDDSEEVNKLPDIMESQSWSKYCSLSQPWQPQHIKIYLDPVSKRKECCAVKSNS